MPNTSRDDQLSALTLEIEHAASQAWSRGAGRVRSGRWGSDFRQESLHAEARSLVLKHPAGGRRTQTDEQRRWERRLEALRREVESLRSELAQLREQVGRLHAEKLREEQDYAERELAAKKIIQGILGHDPADDEFDELSTPVEFTKEEAEAIARLIEGE